MQKAGGIAVVLALAVALGALLYAAGVFTQSAEDDALTGRAVATRDDGAPAPVAETPRPGRLQMFVVDGQSKEAITEFEMRREPAPSANWLENHAADGRFELSGAMNRRMRLRFRAKGYFPNHVDLLYANVPENGVMKAFSLLLEPGYDLHGTVVSDASGAPLAGAHVRAMPSLDTPFEDYAPADPDVPVTLTDADGNFHLSVSPPEVGRFVVVWADDHAVKVIEQDLDAPEDSLEVRLGSGGHKQFFLTQAGGPMGPMHFRLDQPQAGVAVHPIPLEARSAPDVPAEFRFVPEGVYRVRIDAPDGTEWGRATAAVGADVEQTIPWNIDEFGGIFGAVKDFKADVELVVSVVDARYPYVPIFETAPDAAGLFEFGFLPPGPYSVRVAYAGGDAPPEMKKYNVVNGEWREIEVEAPGLPDLPDEPDAAPTPTDAS